MEKQSHEIEYYRDGEQYFYDPRIKDNTVAGQPVKMTSFFSVVDPRWSVEHILAVQQAERESGRSICGAEKKDLEPCKQRPLCMDDEPYPDEIGRCWRHRPSMKKTDMVVEEETSGKVLTKEQTMALSTPLARQMMEIASGEFFMKCRVCINFSTCEDTNPDSCVKEKRIFEVMLAEMITTYDNMDTITDYITSFSIADTMIKIIRTSTYEAQYGILEAINSGTAQYSLALKKLLNGTIKQLGLDRKTRITIRRASGNIEQFQGSIAKALSSVVVDKVEVKTAKIKMKRKEASSTFRGRRGPRIGIDGEEIKDDEPIEV